MPREILSVAEMAAADRAAVERGAPTPVLMERAGEAVARAVRARYAHRPVVIWCGPGDNGGDGYVAARRIRDELGLAVPIIACTASVMDGERDRCEAAGMDDYLSKPVGGSQLAEKLARWIPRAATDRAA